MQENFSSQGRESFGREQGSRGAQRDVLSTGVAEGDQTINAWISQARKLIPTQGKGKKPQIQKGNTPSCCPLQCHEFVLILNNQTLSDQPCFPCGGLEAEMGEWNRSDGDILALAAQSDQQQRVTPCHHLREVLAAGIADLESFPAKPAVLEMLSAWGGP